jgi:hypothetical protein
MVLERTARLAVAFAIVVGASGAALGVGAAFLVEITLPINDFF